ncbi:MAG: fatty acid hydroxylase [Ignavibacteriae bacterium HGW-Ignavibacteriae-3]|nr:MAG: fatty acid hydroxylase [Ignavibacteriae bacterium HGW-Ignavibacteriae-3]
MPKNYISNKDETVRLFENDFLESLSRVHWTLPLWVYIPIIIVLLYRGFFIINLSVSESVLLVIYGLIIWTFTEYILHRFVFHYNPKSRLGKRIHFLIHGVHHDYPKDSKRLVMPPTVSLPLAASFYFLFNYLLGHQYIFPFFAGFLIGYLFYDTTHYAIHHFNMHNRFWLYIKNHHAKHHYQNPNLGYGVSQPTWDFIMGTSFPAKDESGIIREEEQ